MRNWTTGDIRYLRKYAGRIPVHKLALHLKRTQQAVKTQARKHGIDIRYFTQRLVWCSNCCAWRTKLTLGLCPVCTRKQTREQQIEREHYLLSLITPAQRALKRPELHESRIDRLPPLHVPADTSEYEKARCSEADAIATQRIEIANLDRENSTRRRRINRLEKQVGRKDR